MLTIHASQADYLYLLKLDSGWWTDTTIPRSPQRDSRVRFAASLLSAHSHGTTCDCLEHTFDSSNDLEPYTHGSRA